MRPITVSVGPVGTVSATNIATSQTPSAAVPLTLNGSLAVTSAGVTVAVLPSPQRVLITTADSTHSFTITGTTPTGAKVSETVPAFASATAYSALDYATVTSVVISGAATAAVTVGTNGIASTPWVRLDEWANPTVSIQVDVTGTVNYTVQSTLDDPNSPTSPVTPSAVTWINSADTNAVSATASLQTYFQYVPVFARVLLNSGSGSVTATFLQSGAVPY